MKLEIDPNHPAGRKISQAVKILKQDGVIVYPTDTVYALGCTIHSAKALKQICLIKGIKPEKSRFSMICRDISDLSEFVSQLSNDNFKLIKRLTPGPFTFILNGSKKLPKMFVNKRKTIGVRIQNSQIVQALIDELDAPILSTSLYHSDEVLEYHRDPEEIYHEFNKRIDLLIDGGVGGTTPSTVIDLTGREPILIRQGLGELES